MSTATPSSLFGLFVAQVTGSFVTAGAQFVVHDIGIAGKVIAILAFLLATALTAALIGLARDRGRDALPWMLALETVLSAFCPHARRPASDRRRRPARRSRWRVRCHGDGHAERRRAAPDARHSADQRHDRQHDAAWHRDDRAVAAGRLRATPATRLDARTSSPSAPGLLSSSRSPSDSFSAPAAARAYAIIGLIGVPLAVLLVGALTLWAVYRERAI